VNVPTSAGRAVVRKAVGKRERSGKHRDAKGATKFDEAFFLDDPFDWAKTRTKKADEFHLFFLRKTTCFI